MRRTVLNFLLIVVLAACADTRPGDLVEEYSKNIIKLGMRPVYPPREDLQVGDVILASVPKVSANVVALAKRNPSDYVFVYLGNDPSVVNLARNHLKQRVVLQRTTGSGRDTNPDNEQDDLYDGRLATRKERIVSTLPIVAFPRITADAGTGVGLGIVRVLSALGLAGSARTTVSLDFADVRSLRAPEGPELFQSKNKAKHLFLGALRDRDSVEAMRSKFFVELANLIQGRSFRAGQGNSQIKTNFNDRCYRLVIITEVYLARRIDYTYSNAQIVSAALKNAAPTNVESRTKDVATVSPVIIQMNAPGETGRSGASGTIIGSDTAQSIQQRTIDSVKRSQQGDSLTFQSWDALGVRFSRTYERPVTIGWRGFDFEAPPSPLNNQNEKGFRTNDCRIPK